MNNDLRPYMPTHPGEVLKDELQARGISQKKFSSLIGVSYTMLNEILNGKRPISADMSLLLEAALGIDATIWNNMQSRYNLETASVILLSHLNLTLFVKHLVLPVFNSINIFPLLKFRCPFFIYIIHNL